MLDYRKIGNNTSDSQNREFDHEDNFISLKSEINDFKKYYIRLAIIQLDTKFSKYQNDKDYKSKVDKYIQSVIADISNKGTFNIRNVIIYIGSCEMNKYTLRYTDYINAHPPVSLLFKTFKGHICPLTYKYFKVLDNNLTYHNKIKPSLTDLILMITKALKAIKTEYCIDVQLPKLMF